MTMPNHDAANVHLIRNRLRRLYHEFMCERTRTIEDYRRWRPPFVYIQDDLDKHFGKGKSPFLVKEIMIVKGRAHIILAGGKKWSSRKWITKLRSLLHCDDIFFYTEGWNGYPVYHVPKDSFQAVATKPKAPEAAL